MVKKHTEPSEETEKTETIACMCSHCGSLNYYKKNEVATIKVNNLTASTNSNSTLHNGLFIRQKEYYVKIYFDDIVWVEADRSYCYIHTTTRTSNIVTFPLGDVKRLLPPHIFVQIHRSYIININYVDKFIGNMIFVQGESMSISQKYRAEVMTRLLILEKRR